MKPDAVYLNLSVVEFPNKEADLPKDLVQLAQKDKTFIINWVEGPNTKTMKKVFPILKLLDEDDIIIDVDDDLLIPIDFVKTRVTEFVEHNCQFPISGGNNPKWHLNRRIFDLQYNCLTATSIFQKKMLLGYDKILDEVIKTYNDDIVYTMLCLSNGYFPIPTKKLTTWWGVSVRKIKMKNDKFGMKNNRAFKSDEETMQIFQRTYDKTHKISFKQSMFNLVMFDSFDVAGDNAEALYRICRDVYPNIKMTFLISKNSQDWKRLENDGFNLYPIEGKDIDTLFKNASFILWSKDTTLTRLLQKYRDKSIFVSHGTTSRFYDVRNYLSCNIAKSCKYVCCNSNDEASVVKFYTKNQVTPIITGFPRHDILLKKSRDNEKLRNRQLLFSFHYRNGQPFSSKGEFMKTNYYKGINQLLRDSRLKQLSDSGVKVVFMLHARFKKYADAFTVPSYIQMDISSSFQDTFANSDVLVTDFSSTSFEFAYMDKPTFVYIPDEIYVRSNIKQYKIDKMAQYPHLKLCSTLDNLFVNIEQFYSNGSSAKGFAEKTFKYVDTNNTKRLVKWMCDNLDRVNANVRKSNISKKDPKGWKYSQYMFG